MHQDSAVSPSGSTAARPEFPILPSRAVRAITDALVMELLAIDREDAAARRRAIQACNDSAPIDELQAIIRTIGAADNEAKAIRRFLELLDPSFAPEFPHGNRVTPKPLTPEERAQLRALGKPAKGGAQ